LPFALVFTLMWWRPPLQADWSLAVYYAFVYVLYDASATLVYMPYFALTPELTSDYDERTSLTSTRMFFSIVGSLVAFTVPLMMIGSFQPGNAGRCWGWGWHLVSLAIPLWVVFFGAREKKPICSRNAQPEAEPAGGCPVTNPSSLG
jgi:GPH family glycoside/pentoside/hexuronide:cation symporter